MIQAYKHREIVPEDLTIICNFPQDENELFFMYPKAIFPLTIDQIKSSIDSRFDSTVILYEETIIGFANFYEVIKEQYCSIGNVIVNPIYRGKGVGTFLINIMEKKAINKYKVKEMHISCFNQNVTGLLLYYKLGYVPYEIHVTGADQEGIVHRVSHYLSENGINIETLESSVVNAPTTGTPLFSMHGIVQAPVKITLSELRKQLNEIGDEMGTDIEVKLLIK